ncbi:MAG: phosphatase PAP2 family protein [Calditrichota bacterium]|jgi:membrane-associated phospholipid phosphatase
MLEKKVELLPLSRFRGYDLITLLYLGTWMFLILLYHTVIPHYALFFLSYLIAFIFAFLFARMQPINKWINFFRTWYPLFYLPLSFGAFHYLIPGIHPGNIDNTLIKIDLWLIGTNPTVWLEKYHYSFLTEILQISYLAFYFLPLLILVPFFVKKKYKLFNEFALVVLLGFYLSYFGYLIFPALGPRYFLAHLQHIPLVTSNIYNSISGALNGLENIQWDAFPSGHVTIALLYAHYAFKCFRKMFFFTLPVVILLVISTVYLRYHYFIDVIAGIMLYGIVLVMSKWIKQIME